MPEKYKTQNTVESYRRYYAGDKWRFAKWKHQVMPQWLPHYMKIVWDEDMSNDRAALVEQFSRKRTLPMDARIFSFARKIVNDQKTLKLAKEAATA